jgi:hypothetical protein
MTMKPKRLSVAAAITSVVGATLAGILGGVLANRWTWGLAAGVLALIAVSAAAEAIKALREEPDTKVAQMENSESDERDKDAAKDGNRVVSIAAGYENVITDAVIAAGDVDNRRTQITDNRRTQIRRNSTWPWALAVCLLALTAGTGGTVYFSTSRGGGAYHPDKVQAAATTPSTDHPGSERPSPSHPAGLVTASGQQSTRTTWSIAATYTETDSTDDSATQVMYIGTPRSAATIPGLADAITNPDCGGDDGTDTPGRDLAVPFYIESTLDSSVAVQVSLNMGIGQFFDSSYNSDGLDGVVYGDVADGSGDTSGCEMPLTTTLTQEGVPSYTSGWLILANAITADQPGGDMDALGQTYVYLSAQINDDSQSYTGLQVKGTGVCLDSNDAGIGSNQMPNIHIDGPAPSWEECTGFYSSSDA